MESNDIAGCLRASPTVTSKEGFFRAVRACGIAESLPQLPELTPGQMENILAGLLFQRLR